MEQSQNFKHFSVLEWQKRQINIVAPCLFHEKERASILRILLLKRGAIEEVQVNSDDNSVLIEFDAEALSKNDLFILLDGILANFSEKPREVIKKIGGECPRCGGSERKVVFYLEGMSCASCALYLEMVLSRNERVNSADIDYKSKKGFVVGCLSQDDVFDIVEKHGYKAHSIDCKKES
jgi:Cu+-exporting ATPase